MDDYDVSAKKSAKAEERIKAPREDDAREEPTGLIVRLREGDPTAFRLLLEKYEPLIAGVVESFRKTSVLKHAEREDLIQDAALALYKAAIKYDITQQNVTFGLYAKICITNRLVSVKRQMERRKRSGTSRLSSSAGTGDTVGSAAAGRENYLNLLEYAEKRLTAREYAVLRYYLSGTNYKEIACRMNCSIKSVDNALQRAKRKLKKQHLHGE